VLLICFLTASIIASTSITLILLINNTSRYVIIRTKRSRDLFYKLTYCTSLTGTRHQPPGCCSLSIANEKSATCIYRVGQIKWHHFTFLPARRYASAGNSDRNVSVRLSVCLSVTRRYCVKTKKASGMISSPSGSAKTLVFWCQISSPNSKGFPPNWGLKQGSVGKIQRFFSFKRLYLENGSRYG